MKLPPEFYLLAMVVLLAATGAIPYAKGKSSSGITREEAWRVFFASRRAVLKIVLAVLGGLAFTWWALLSLDLGGGDNLLDAVVACIKSDDTIFNIAVQLALAFWAVVLCIHFVGLLVCLTVIREFAFMHGIAQTRRWWTFNAFAMDKCAKHPLLQGRFYPLYYYAFSWRASLVILAILIILALVLFLPHTGL